MWAHTPHPSMRLRHAASILGALPIIAASLSAQVISASGSMPTVRSGTARRLAQPVVVIDGRLNDAAWRDARCRPLLDEITARLIPHLPVRPGSVLKSA